MKADRTAEVTTRRTRQWQWKTAILAMALLLFGSVQAQVLFNEQFTGGASTTGFTLNQVSGTTTWSYNNPGGQTFAAPFDSDFAIFDSDFAGSSGGNSRAELISPAFDATSGSILLTFDEYYRECCVSTAEVYAYDGSTWTLVFDKSAASGTFQNGPVESQSLDITVATGGSPLAQVKFVYEGDWAWFWALDNISVTAISCALPSTPLASNVTTTGADLAWTASSPAPAIGYIWEVRSSGNAGDPSPDATGTTGSGVTTDVVSGLTPNTTYTLYVQADCGGSTSPWISTTFTTQCNVATLPMAEDFETLTLPPPCWGVNDGVGLIQAVYSTPGDGIANGPSGSPSDSASIRFLFYNVSSGSATLSSAEFTPVPANYRVRFDVAGAAYTSTIDSVYLESSSNAGATWSIVDGMSNEDPVGVLNTAGTTTSGFVPSGPAQWTNLDYAIPAGTNMVRFRAVTSFGNYVYIDNVTVEEIPACLNPTAPLASNVTNNSADLSWTASVSDPANGYQWELRTSGVAGDPSPNFSGNTGYGITSAPGVGVLASNTTYTLYVRADCGGVFSPWTTAYNFHTLCDVFPAPYTEDFEAAAGMPDCWSNQGPGENWLFRVANGPPGWGVAGAVDHTTGSGNFAWIDGSSNILANGLESPNVDFSALASPFVSFWMLSNNVDDAALNQLRLDAWDGATWAPLATFSGNDPNWVKHNTAIPGSIPTTTRFRLVALPSATGSQFYNDLLVDDFSVINIGACSALPAPGATTGPASACSGVPFTLGITNESIDTGISYQWETSPNGSSWSNAPGVSTNSTYVTSQTATTWYRCQVTCAGNGTAASSDYQVTMSAPTACYCTPAFSTIEPICDVTFADISNTTSSTVGGTPAVEDFTAVVGNVKAGSTYMMSLTGNSDGGFTNFFTAFFDWDQDGTFETAVPIGSFTGSVCTAVVSGPVTVPLTATVGATRMRIIKNYNASPADACGSYGFGQAEDYTLNVTLPTCFAPVATVTDLTGGTQATIDWTNNASVSYNWELRDSGLPGDPLPIASGYHVAAGPAIIPGLTPGANYTFYIQG
ncbi:MAG: fibronectin type III domain-containing protein, partial [Flavobacteriales bacterium]|nr:fibronectin type III domain-containing protein [Flavobacteriales bacterium]